MDDTKQNRIFLTGFMGSGKSTIGPILANTLGYSFIDIDKEIERSTGKEIIDIFSELGEGHFREVERSVLLEACRLDKYVISLGGGTISNQSNLDIIKSSGILIYLKTTTEQIHKRLKHKTNRPLILVKSNGVISDQELTNRINELLTQREPYYSQADIIISTDVRKLGITVDQIMKNLKPFFK